MYRVDIEMQETDDDEPLTKAGKATPKKLRKKYINYHVFYLNFVKLYRFAFLSIYIQ